MGYHTSPSNDLSNQCVRTKDARSTGYKRHRPRAIIWPETRFLTRLALSYHFLWACLMVRTGFELSRPTIQQTGGSRRSPFNWSYQDLSYVSFWNVIFAIKKNSSAIYRGYYPVVGRYEVYFRVAKQYFKNERSEWVKYCFCHEKIKFISSSRCVMFFLLYRQKDIDKISMCNQMVTSEIRDNFTSIPFDYLLISWVTHYVSNLGFSHEVFACLSRIVYRSRTLLS